VLPSRTAAVARPVLKDAHVSQEEGLDGLQVHRCGRAGRRHHRLRIVIERTCYSSSTTNRSKGF
jgi:hypothetical protein